MRTSIKVLIGVNLLAVVTNPFTVDLLWSQAFELSKVYGWHILLVAVVYSVLFMGFVYGKFKAGEKIATGIKLERLKKKPRNTHGLEYELTK